MGVLSELEPKGVWQLFEGLARVPRPSKDEERVQEHVLRIAADHGWPAHRDATGNIVIQVPATRGREGVPTVVLQGHLDMVAEKNRGVEHDFHCDPIPLEITEDSAGAAIVQAKGTTLGADNGMGVCLALAAASDPDVVHGPLELLFTCDEEDGMTGAKAVTPDLFGGRILLNLDSEEDDTLYIGCAGGCDTNLSWRIPVVAVEGTAWQVEIGGLRGGHSGGDIHENRANANRLLGLLLADERVPAFGLARIHGGSKRNAIPREAEAVVVGPDALGSALEGVAEELLTMAREAHGDRDAVIRVRRLEGARPATCIASAEARRVAEALVRLPNGPLGMHPQMTDLVQVSNNISTITMPTDAGSEALSVQIGMLTRSSSEQKMDATLGEIEQVAGELHAETSHANRYPGWDPQPESELLTTCEATYGKLFGKAPAVRAIHAGLECGIIGERVGEMEMISFGPRIEGAHSPDERIWVESVQKIWRYLQAVLVSL